LKQKVSEATQQVVQQQTKQQGLVLDIDDLKEKQQKMNDKLQSLSISITDKSNTLQNLLLDITQKEAETRAKNNDKQKLEEQIMTLMDSASNLTRLVGEMNDKIRNFYAFEDIKRENHKLGNKCKALDSTLLIYKDSLDRIGEELRKTKIAGSETERKKKENLLLFSVICSLLALGIIITQYLRMRVIKRAKRRLAEKKAELEEKNKEVEEKNHQLEDKRKKLEDLVQRLHNSTEELNHRTKNNLQQVSAMLLMQEEETGDVEAKDALQDARSRIDVLGILHRLLYESQRDNYTKMELSQFIQKLTEHVVMANSSPKRRPETHIDVASVEVKMERAVQVNELIQNCFKHAFKTTTTNPTLDVRLHTIGKDIELSIRDNGPGMPPGAPSIEESSSFGLKLVHLIVSGIGGTILCENDGGLVCKVVFPIDES
jgi:two-component sensor histidine kinase